MDLVILAIGLVLGGACMFAAFEMRSAWTLARDAKEIAQRAHNLASSVHTAVAGEDIGGRINTHDHEIATIYDRLNLKRN
jgi:hypothetical protein